MDKLEKDVKNFWEQILGHIKKDETMHMYILTRNTDRFSTQDMNPPFRAGLRKRISSEGYDDRVQWFHGNSLTVYSARDAKEGAHYPRCVYDDPEEVALAFPGIWVATCSEHPAK